MPGTNRFLPDCGGQFKNPSMVLPDCRTVDYTDCEDIAGYGHLLLSLLQRTPEYNCTSTPSISAAPIIQASKEWLRLVEKNIINLNEEDVLDLISYYDLIYRLIYRIHTHYKYINDCIMHVFDIRINGNYQISESQLFRAISTRLDMCDKSFWGRPLQWVSMTLNEWYKSTCSGMFNELLISEALRRVAIILQKDMFTFCGRQQELYKQRLVDFYLKYINGIETFDSDTLLALLQFVRSLRGKYLDLNKSSEYEFHIMFLLSEASGLNTYHRQAFRLDADLLKNTSNNVA